MTTLAQYDRARAALAEATRIDEILPLRDQMQHIKLHARHVQDRELMADATEIQIRAETKLGLLLKEAKKAGLLKASRPKKVDPKKPADADGFTLKEIGVTEKLSSTAQKKASITEQALEAMISGIRARIISGKAKIIEQTTDEKKEKRANREKLLAGIQLALPDKKYGVIYADPEWRFEVYSRETGMDRAADNHYQTSPTEAIMQRPVEQIAADDCVLFLWATVPMLPNALDVVRAWGFEYKSHCIWRKDRIGTGYWFRNVHELLLVATRGKVPAPAMGDQFESVIDAPLGKHSEKPDRFYELIESYFPNLPKIELNARRARRGWDAWGFDAPQDAAGIPLAHNSATGEIIEASA